MKCVTGTGTLSVLTILGLVAMVAAFVLNHTPAQNSVGGREAQIGPTCPSGPVGPGSRLDTLYARNVDEVYTLAMQQMPQSTKPVHLHKYSRIHCVCTNAEQDEWLIRSLALLSIDDKSLVSLYTPLDKNAPDVVELWLRLVDQGVLSTTAASAATAAPATNYLVLHCAIRTRQNESVSEHIARQHSMGATQDTYRTSQRREDEVRKAYHSKKSFTVTTLTSFIHSKVLKAMFPRIIVSEERRVD